MACANADGAATSATRATANAMLLLFKRLLRSRPRERGQRKLRSAKERRCALSVPPCETGRARSRRDEDGDGSEGRKGGPRRSGQRSPDCASGRVQRPCNEECGQRERELECEPEEERRLEGRRPRNVTCMDEPLEELLDAERDRPEQHGPRRG